ncbi:hypothetical protein [Sorangium sp. So ce176]|uniref:hypothetical protein n=1 Tax=Sorangium sp. So ce176 TaxID=3133286 RepID=UPI003F6010CD
MAVHLIEFGHVAADAGDLAIALTYTAPEQIAGRGVEEHRGGVRTFRRTEGSGR